MVRPEVDDISTGGREVHSAGRRLVPRPGLCADQAHGEAHGEDAMREYRAFRLELLTDPNLPLGGPGRSIKGTGALTEFEVEAAPADDAGEDHARSRSRARRPISICRRRRSTPMFYDKIEQEARDGPDRVRDRRQGRDGVGHRCRSRPAQSAAQSCLQRCRSRSRMRRRHDPHLLSEAECTAAGTATTTRTTIWAASGFRSPPRRMRWPIRCPQNVREILAIPRDAALARAGADGLQLLAHHGSRVERRERHDRRAVAASIPKALRNWCWTSATKPRETHI